MATLISERPPRFDGDIGVKTYYEVETGAYIFHRSQNVAPILEANQNARNDTGKRFGEGRLVAKIPMALFLDWKRRGYDFRKMEPKEQLRLIEQFHKVKTTDARLI